VSCRTPVATVDGRQVTTVEGLASGGTPHPVRQAFPGVDGKQSGFRTPGQVNSAGALIEARPDRYARHRRTGLVGAAAVVPDRSVRPVRDFGQGVPGQPVDEDREPSTVGSSWPRRSRCGNWPTGTRATSVAVA
jgi:hypothetical protein